MCFGQVSEYGDCTVEGLHASTKFLCLGFLHSLYMYFSPVYCLWPSIAMLSSYERQSGTRSRIFFISPLPVGPNLKANDTCSNLHFQVFIFAVIFEDKCWVVR